MASDLAVVLFHFREIQKLERKLKALTQKVFGYKSRGCQFGIIIDKSLMGHIQHSCLNNYESSTKLRFN